MIPFALFDDCDESDYQYGIYLTFGFMT